MASNPLRAYFDAHHTGHGIWKWHHYFDIYHRHFERFRGTDVHVMEIGIYSGGSMGMWRDYFGPKCHVYGVDIEEACRVYEDDKTHIFIGDQGDKNFWASVKSQVPRLDILIDDGSHKPEHQMITVNEVLPHLQPGGVFLCEDLSGADNRFAGAMAHFALQLNHQQVVQNPENPERRIVHATSGIQTMIHSVHFYPFVTVIEKNSTLVTELVAAKRGTQWQPFLK